MKKINVGNDQHLWRKALGKQLKKSEKHKKAKNQKHGRKMLWSDKESKIPTIILDECIYSDTLHEKVHALGYNVIFMGSGLPDDKISEKGSRMRMQLVKSSRMRMQFVKNVLE